MCICTYLSLGPRYFPVVGACSVTCKVYFYFEGIWRYYDLHWESRSIAFCLYGDRNNRISTSYDAIRPSRQGIAVVYTQSRGGSFQN